MSEDTKITPEQAVTRMKEIATSSDTEVAHICADNLLCEILRQQGFGELVDEFVDMEKWYA